MAKDNTIVTALYAKTEKSLSTKEIQKEYKDSIDRYIAKNADKYFTPGPSERPIFGTADSDKYIRLCGITKEEIKTVIKGSKSIGSNWYIMNDPFNIANALATRYFSIKKNAEMVKLTQSYLIVSMYPSIHFKYFKYGTNEACMNYTINNLSEKYKLRQLKNLWNVFMDMISTAYELHKENIIRGNDQDFVKYIQDIHTRMNSLVKNVAGEYYKNYENQKFLETEYENFDDDSYREADSNSYEIQRIADNVVNHLVVHGPDMKLVELAAKSSNVSVNELRTYATILINGKHRQDIWDITEAILFLFLFNNDGEHHSVQQIRSNEFMIYCLKIYKRSNTTDKNIVKIKKILDKWIDEETSIREKSSRAATVLSYKKAFYMFFVLSIEKYGR